MIITFRVPGVPRGKKRPRFARRGNFVTTYQPEEDKKRESLIRACYLKAAGDIGPYDGPVAITIEALFTVPASWSQKKKACPGPMTSKPDLDNIVKSVLDALNKVAYLDDAQIVKQSSSKRRGANDEMTVTIERIGATADLFEALPAEG